MLRGPYSVSFEEPWADDEMVAQHPESDVRTFLEASAASLGLVLDREAKIRALQGLCSISIGNEEGKPSSRIDKASMSATPGDRESSGKEGDDGNIRCAEDVYAAVVTALSQALVHCERFEVHPR